MTALIEAFWKSGAILGLGLCVALLLGKRSADARRLILTAAVVATLLAALASPLLPRLNVPEPRWLTATPATHPTTFPTLATGKAAASSPLPAPPPHPRAAFPEAIPFIWFTGAMLLLTRLSLGLYVLRRLRGAACPVSGDILQSTSLTAPVTWGILRPVILVPAGFERLSDESREAILCHERAHIQAYDFFFRIVAEVVRALIWFQPLTWIVARRLREEQELACDDRVLASGIKPSAYARLLLDWDFAPVTAAIGMASRGGLKRRLYALLATDAHRERVTAAAVLATCLLALATALPLAAMSWTRPATTLAAQAQAARIPPPAATSPSPLAFFVTQSMLIVEDVTVASQDAASVQGLSAGDFAITEDGKPMRPFFAEMGRVLFEQQGLASSGIASYRIGYYTTNAKADGTHRSVKISLKNSDAKVTYRADYDVPGGTPTGAYEPVNLPAGVTPPELIAKFEPAYSDEARRAKLSGSVTLTAVVDETGKAVNIVVRQPIGSGLDESAIDALKRWRFRPASNKGAAISAPIRVEMSFYLL